MMLMMLMMLSSSWHSSISVVVVHAFQTSTHYLHPVMSTSSSIRIRMFFSTTTTGGGILIHDNKYNYNDNNGGGPSWALYSSSISSSSSSSSSSAMKKKDLRTLQRFLEVECWKTPSIRSLDTTLLAVSDACKQINRIVQRAQTDDLYGPAAAFTIHNPTTTTTGQEEEEVVVVNVQGEIQQQLDVLCNTLMLRALCVGGNGGSDKNAVCAVASEEEPLPRCCADVMGYHVVGIGGDGIGGRGGNDDTAIPNGGGGKYVAVFDPIDGSKNIDASLPVGTIFGIYRCPEGGGGISSSSSSVVNVAIANGDEGGLGQPAAAAAQRGGGGWDANCFLQRGTQLVAAGYCLYSATTILVLTLGSGVHGFTLDPDRQIFLQTHPNMRIPDVGSLYSFNEANSRDYSMPVKEFLKTMKETGKMG